MLDHYKTLGVTESSSADEIKAAYRKLAMQHHPDRNGGSTASETKLKELNEAYDTLKDPTKKADYDAQRKYGKSPYGRTNTKGWGHTPDGDMEDAIRDLYESLLKEKNFAWGKSQYGGYDAFGRKTPYETPKNPNIRVALEVPLKSIIAEQKRAVNVNAGPTQFTIEVTIPKGVRTGTVVTYKGKGSQQIKDAPAGDLIVEFIVTPDANFERQYDDLISYITIDSLQAIVGTDYEFTTIHDRKIKITIPPGTQNGATFRVTGQGLPSQYGVGHQFIKVTVKTATNLTKEQMDQIRFIVNTRV